ncbi:MAG: DUF2621 family protein [bacterium]
MDWSNEAKELLSNMLLVIPAQYKELAKNGVISTAEKIAGEAHLEQVTQDAVARGFLKSTPKEFLPLTIDSLEAFGVSLADLQIV